MNNSQFLHGMFGGKNGGKYIATATADAEIDFLFVASDTVFTTLTDSADVDLVAAKALTALTVPAGVYLSAGTGKKIKAVSYSSGTVFGYTLETSTV